jgi:hypothetical protein
MPQADVTCARVGPSNGGIFSITRQILSTDGRLHLLALRVGGGFGLLCGQAGKVPPDIYF